MKKKTLIFLFTAMFSCMLAFVLTGCNGCNKNKSCAHEFGALVAGTPVTCETDGSRSYYECGKCHLKFAADKKTRLSDDDLVIPAGHAIAYTENGKAATCEKEGIKPYSYCSACGKYLDENGNEIKNYVTPRLLHSFETADGVYDETKKTAFKEATCEENGNQAYYHCDKCGGYYEETSSGLEKKDKNDLVIPKTNHSYNRVAYTPATCTENGEQSHYRCNKCDKYFDASFNAVTKESLVIPAGHKTEFVAGKPATCTESGEKARYHCKVCEKNFETEECAAEISDVVVAATGHTFYTNGVLDESKKIARKEPTATENGWIEHYHCDACGKDFNAAGENTGITLVFNHEMTWVGEVPADCGTGADGVAGHYVCNSGEGAHYHDKNGNVAELSSFTIPAAHDYGELVPASSGDCLNKAHVAYYKCSKCNKYFDEGKVEKPENEIFVGYGNHVLGPYLYHDDNYHYRYCEKDGCTYSEKSPHMEIYVYDTEIDKDGRVSYRTECSYDCGLIKDEGKISAIVDMKAENLIYAIGYEGNELNVMVTESDGYSYTVYNAVNATELETYLNEVGTDFEGEKKKSLAFTYRNLTKQFEVTFVVYKVLEVKPASAVQQYSAIQDLNLRYMEYRLVTTAGEQYLSGNVTVADSENERLKAITFADGETEKAFTYKLTYNDKEYDATIYISKEKAVQQLFLSDPSVVQGTYPRVTLFYTDNTSDDEPVFINTLDDMGGFDVNKPGVQTVTLRHKHAVLTVKITVLGLNEVKETRLMTPKIKLGEKFMLVVKYNSGKTELVPIEENMIASGGINYSEAGVYDFTVQYKGYKNGILYQATIVDPNDMTVVGIYLVGWSNEYEWLIDENEEPIADVEGLYFNVNYANGDNKENVAVTRDMITFDMNEAKEVIAGTRESLTVTITYMGAQYTFNVKFVSSRDENAINAINCSDDVYVADGELQKAFVSIRTDKGAYFVPLTESMLYVKNSDGNNVNFDIKNAKCGFYDLSVVYGAKECSVSVVVYKTKDVKYVLTANDNNFIAYAGTKEEVFKSFEKLTYYYLGNITYDGEGTSVLREKIAFSRLRAGSLDGIDFSKPGKITVMFEYNNSLLKLSVNLIAKASESTAKKYYSDGYFVKEVILYDNGYCSYFDGNEKTIFGYIRAEDILIINKVYYKEVYVINEDLCSIKDMEQEYLQDKTCRIFFKKSNGSEIRLYETAGIILSVESGTINTAEYSNDGKSVIIDGARYDIIKETVEGVETEWLKFVVEGKTVYTWKSDENEEEGTYTLVMFNDNGKVYQADYKKKPDGEYEESYDDGVIYDWRKEGNEIIVSILGTDVIVFEVDENNRITPSYSMF